MEDLKILDAVLSATALGMENKTMVLNAEWRKDTRSTHSGVTVDAWYGSLGEEAAMYLELTTNVDGKTVARGIAAARAEGIMEVVPLNNIVAKYYLSLMATKPENVRPLAGNQAIQTPFWAHHFFLMERLPGLMDRYTWSGMHGEKGLQLVGHEKETPEYYLRIEHEPSKPQHLGTLAYLCHVTEGEKLINFPVTKRFLDTAMETWKSQQAEESN